MSDRIAFLFTRLLIELFRFVPFRVLYVLSDGLAFFFHHVLHYRRQVMRDALRRAFPEKSEAGRRAILRGAYRNLTDITLETIKGFTTPPETLRRRSINLNPELVNQYLDRGQSVIVSGSHLNNWEWPCVTIPAPLNGPCITAYKPLSNPLVDRYYNSRRIRGGMIMARMEETALAVRQYQGRAAAFFLVADQSPSNRKTAQWVPFLNHDSAFLPGIDLLARRYGYPVLYFHVERVRRGYYELSYREVWPEPAKAGESDITRVYAQVMEEIIREQPQNWLWSHKRWKMQR